MSRLEVFSELQKKHLEKVYQKVFEGGNLSEDGRMLCQQAAVKVEDLQMKTLEEFTQPKENKEIAQIRYEHFLTKRLSKLQILSVNRFLEKLNQISQLMEEMVAQKRMEQEMAEAAYHRKKQSSLKLNDDDLQTSAFGTRPMSQGGPQVTASTLFSSGIYKQKLNNYTSS